VGSRPEPGQWEADVVAADGGTVHLRAIRPDDGDRLRAFHARQSPESIYYRFFSPRPHLSDAEVEHLVNVDYVDRMAFVAVLGDEIIGVARYDRWPERDEAEVAFFIDDAHNGRGLATILLEYLAAAARQSGLHGFTAQVLPDNRRMLGVFRQAGFDVASRFVDGVIEVHLSIESTDSVVAAIDDRARRSEARSVARVLAPSRVAVVGAGRAAGTLGHELLRNVATHGFHGEVYAVNPAGDEVGVIAGVPVRTSLADVPAPVDLVLIAVPAGAVPGVIDECVDAGAQAAVIVSTGFAESGPAGAAAERAVIATARAHGMRVLGPASMGVINTDPDVCLHATAVAAAPDAGTVALGTQTGALGAAILDRAVASGIGISTFVSVGNRADISANDLLRFWEDDERTGVVLLHVGSFGNPRRFSRIARRVSARKPIVAVRGNPGAVVDALLRQTGLIRVESLDQMLHVARVLSLQVLPAGDGVAVVANAADASALAIDALEGAGLRVTVVTDLSPDADASRYARAVGAALAADRVDAVLAIYAPPLPGDDAGIAAAIARAAAPAPGKPVVASFLNAGPVVAGLPNFTFPDRAAAAMAATARYALWRRELEGEVPAVERLDVDAARAVVAAALEGNPAHGRLDTATTFALLAAAGVDVPPFALVDSVAAAGGAAAAIGGAVALKATGLDRLARTEAAGTAIDLQGPDEVRGAYERMCATLGAAMEPALVQQMIAPGVDVRIGGAVDAIVGPVVSFGRGGAGTDLEPVAPDRVRLVPLTDVDAARLVDGSDVAALLDADGRAAVEGLLHRVAQLMEAVPDIAALYLNPIIVTDGVATVVDARARVAPWMGDVEAPVRRLETP
jgi:acyl-CoA synthetase (NDP forming)/RimJ/RimL family protein N-acetyltransferase